MYWVNCQKGAEHAVFLILLLQIYVQLHGGGFSGLTWSMFAVSEN